MYLRISIAFFATLFLSFGVATTSATGLRRTRSLNAVSVFQSPKSDRRNYVPFPSQKTFDVADSVFVFVAESNKRDPIQSVTWKVDGVTVQVENISPWDLGGGSSYSARPFLMSTVGPGSHVLQVDVVFFRSSSSVDIPFTVVDSTQPTTTTTTTTVAPPTTTTTTTTVAPPTTTTAATEAPPSDLRQFLKEKIDNGEKFITVPPGSYRVTPDRKVHLSFNNVHGVTISAYGAEMICTETTRAINIYKCTDFKILGLTIDYDPLPYTQGKITQLSADKKVHDIEIFDGYPSAKKIVNQKLGIFDPNTRMIKIGNYYTFTTSASSDKNVRLTRTGSYLGEEVGDIIAVRAEHAPGGSIPHGVVAADSSGLVLEDVTLYGSNMFGFFETNCDASQYTRCSVDRRPLDSDIVARGDARIRSTNADAFHSKYAGNGLAYTDCFAHYMADDAVAINGNYDMVVESTGTSTLRVLGKKNKISCQVGDPLEVISFTGERFPDATVVSITEMTVGATQEDLDFLQTLGLASKFKSGADLQTAFLVKIDRSINLPKGSLIAPGNRLGNGFSVTGGDFGSNRSRGILVKASNGEIRGNRVSGTVMEAIKVAPEYWWLEGGSSNDVTIEGNIIHNCETGIKVAATGGNREVAPAGAHNNIWIENNSITSVSEYSIKVTSTTNLVLRGNSVEKDVVLEKCTGVTTK